MKFDRVFARARPACCFLFAKPHTNRIDGGLRVLLVDNIQYCILQYTQQLAERLASAHT